MKNHSKCLAALVLAASAVSSFAQQNYGTLISGTFQPTQTFATLSTTASAGGTVYDFTLTAFDLNTIFTNGAFIGALAVDLGSSSPLPTVSNIMGGSDSPVEAKTGSGPGGTWEFKFKLANGQNRLTANETVSWRATFASAVNFEGREFAMHVQGLTDAQGTSAWYDNTPVTAVPEVETYALMLAGLGVIGAIARRRNKTILPV